ncbi:hypothetical protein KP509_21G021100 [Ceratopteris richardii]|nr:hypothetical protein KP509_21G021100 [Ceratopteris richardii]
MEEGEAEEEEEGEWICNVCTFRNRTSSQLACSMCNTVRRGFSWFQRFTISLSIWNISRLMGKMLSCILTGVFALAVGAFTGAVTGGLAGRASQSGLLRGAGLGAVAGAVLSVEVLEASRAYWQSEHLGSSSFPSLGDFLEDLISGRFVQDFLAPAVSSAQRWELNFTELNYEDLYEMFLPFESRTKGASEELLKSLPKHTVTQINKRDAWGDIICCAICLQELEQSDTARALPGCQHTFHLQCVDRWLVTHMICPVCRQYIQ